MKRNYTIPTANSFSTDDSHDEVQSESYSCVKRPSQNIQNDSTLSSIILNPNFLFVRKLQLKYVGTFAVTVKYLPTFGGSELSSENSLKKKYFCHSFDKGTLWSAKVRSHKFCFVAINFLSINVGKLDMRKQDVTRF